MSKYFSICMLAFLFLNCTGRPTATNGQNPTPADSGTVAESEEMIVDTVPPGVKILMKVYPQQVVGFRNDSLLMADGTAIIYDDGQEKDFVTMLDRSDPEDMFSMTYDPTAVKPAYLADAGRSRCEQLFKAMYGHSAAEVEKRMERVDWFGQKILFTKVNGASDSLRAVAKEMQQHPEFVEYMKGSSSFYWRTVRGAKRQSAHSYGIAIDINTSLSDYWLWSNSGASETDSLKYANRVPEGIVRIFENHGFIWGGRWYHYDTMHFEFRPEYLTEP